MGKENFTAPNITNQIFESHFRRAFSAEDYDQAKTLFEQVGAYNERSIAIQLHVAHHAGKLHEVFEAWDKLAGPDGYLHLVPDFITRAAEVRQCIDVVYGSVIMEQATDPWDWVELSQLADIPKIFDLMSSPGDSYAQQSFN